MRILVVLFATVHIKTIIGPGQVAQLGDSIILICQVAGLIPGQGT